MNDIYLYINKKNGHKYVGLAKDAKRRFKDHLRSSFNPNHKDYNEVIHKAIRKYGIENFDFIILESNLPSLEKMKEREQYWIKYYNTYENREHYNQTPGGDAPGYNTIHKGEDHGMAKLSKKEVIFCRQEYQKGTRSREIYNTFFKEKITWEGFLRMWHGKSWKNVMPEVFKNNPHKGKYTAEDRDKIISLYNMSNLSLSAFVKSKECYVGYGTLYKMIHNPSFYDNK